MNQTSSGLVIFDRAMREQRDYWIKRLSDLSFGSNIRLDYERPDTYSSRKASLEFNLTGEAFEKVTALATGDFLLYTTLMAALKICLYKHTQAPVIVVGSPARRHDGDSMEKPNALVLVDNLDDATTCKQVLLDIRQNLLDAYARQNYPFDRLVSDLGLDDLRNRCALFDIALSLNGIHGVLPDVKNDITITCTRGAASLTGTVDYNSTLFDSDSITRFTRHFLSVLTAMPEKTGAFIADLELMDEQERRQVLVDFNATKTDFTCTSHVCALFEEQVEQTPDSTVLSFEGHQITYREINRRANHLAHYLRELGARQEVVVGVLMERSVDIIVAVLGTLKAGAAYLPLDPELPVQRLAFMLEDARASVLLTTRSLIERSPLPVEHAICFDRDWLLIEQRSGQNLEGDCEIDGLAYLIYTSGSTGTPKGVMVSHRGLSNLAQAQIEWFRIDRDSKLFQFASLSFDASVSEILTTLLAGGTLCLGSRDSILPGPELIRALREQAVSVITLPPSIMEIISGDELPALRTVVAAGEPCSAQLVKKWAAGRLFLNAYGPTETTVCASIGGCGDARRPPHIGRPINNTRVYLLEGDTRPAAIGTPAEIHIAGSGIARGYLNRPDLTAEKFAPDPYSDEGGARMYRTGDLARHTSSGEIEFLGRIDHQVKIRGFRIELGEVESLLAAHNAVRRALVIAREDEPGEKRLVAYIVSAQGKSVKGSELRRSLSDSLPEFMLPSAFVFLDELPLLSNGKVDRKRLPPPDNLRPELKQAYVAPRNPIEEIIASILSHVLGLDQIGIHDNFFELGGHSLLATQVTSRLRSAFNVDSPLHSIFDMPTVAGLARYVDSALRQDQRIKSPPITPVSRSQPLPLSFAQQRLWFLDQLQPDSPFYNIPLGLRLKGHLDIDVIRRCFDELVRRHEVLRTTFANLDGQLSQVIAPAETTAWPLINLEDLSAADREAEVGRLAADDAKRPFDLRLGPLFRVQLLRLGADEHIVLLNMHHIVSDGWSMTVLIREMSTLHDAFSRGHTSPLPELPIQYADFARWQQTWLQGEALEEQIRYWKRQIGSAPPVVDLQTDRPRPALQAHRGAHRPFFLSSPSIADLTGLNREEGVTMFMSLLAVFQAVLSRLTGQEDIVIGTDVANRNRIETERLIGFFVNQLVLRTDLSGSPGFRDLLQRVKTITLGAYAHQDLPFEKLVQAIQPERDMARAPLFQIKLILQNAPSANLDLAGLSLSPTPVESATSKFDMTWSIVETRGGLAGSIEYDTDLFDAQTIDRLICYFGNLLQNAVAEPDRPIADLPLLKEDELRRILVEWNQTQTGEREGACIDELFEEQVSISPDAVALSTIECQVTYLELNRRANQLARHLRAIGVGPEMKVGLCIGRSVDMVIAVLGILKAGGAYVPLDASYPVDRLAYILEDACIPIIISREELTEKLPATLAQLVCLDGDSDLICEQPDDNLIRNTVPDNLAYVIYTSGSTGKPKGVLVQHSGLANLSRAQKRAFGVHSSDRVLQFSSLNFDASVFEMIMALCAGASLSLAPQESLIPGSGLVRLIQDACITNVTLPPSVLAALPIHKLSALRTLIVAGEACPNALAQRWSGERSFFNAYGPTETTVWATVTQCGGASKQVHIGKPIDNVRTYLLDRRRQPVPVGVPGELHIAGVNLARGYQEKPELTAERFTPDPFCDEAGARMYITGDVARYTSSGDIEFIGRIDHQVKIRGFRVELGEVESALIAHPRIREAVAQVREDRTGDKRMVAYLVVNEGDELDSNVWRNYLKGRLPDYMIPSAFVYLDSLPLTHSGKLDRAALAEMAEMRAGGPIFVAPRTRLEKVIAGVWQEALNLERVSIDDNFFDLGGHSLLMAQVHDKLGQVLSKDVSIVELFTYPNISSLAKYLTQHQPQEQIIQDVRERAAKQTQAINRQREILREKAKGNE